jgi:hypothetical protein
VVVFPEGHGGGDMIDDPIGKVPDGDDVFLRDIFLATRNPRL